MRVGGCYAAPPTMQYSSHFSHVHLPLSVCRSPPLLTDVWEIPCTERIGRRKEGGFKTWLRRSYVLQQRG